MKKINNVDQNINEKDIIYLRNDCLLRESLGEGNPNFKVTSLVDVEDFVKILGDNNRVYYGGDQSWHGRDTLGHLGGCGTTAVSNMLTYLAKSNLKNKGLYSSQLENISKSDFTNYMKEVYEYVTPREIKLPFLKPILVGKALPSKVQKETKLFGLSKDVIIKSSSRNIFRGIDSKVDFIRDSLADDNPVAMLVWYNKRLDNIDFFRSDGSVTKQRFELHWVTITGMSENIVTGDKYVLVSSWGGKAIINLKHAQKGGAMFLVNFRI